MQHAHMQATDSTYLNSITKTPFAGTIIINQTTPAPTKPTTSVTTTTTSTSTSTTASTTTSAKTPTPENETVEGSGEETTDTDEEPNDIEEKTCEELYNEWVDPDFPGGKPPPLGQDETINKELCEFLKTQAKTRRQKRHRISDDEDGSIKNDKISDIDKYAYQNDENIELNDLSFYEGEDGDIIIVETDTKAKAAAVKGNDKSDGMQTLSSGVCIILSCAISLFFVLI